MYTWYIWPCLHFGKTRRDRYRAIAQQLCGKKPGNMKEFDSYQRNVRKLTNSQGIVR